MSLKSIRLIRKVYLGRYSLLSVSPFPYCLYQTLSGVVAANSGIAPHAALPHPLPAPKHMHHVWVWNGMRDHSVCPIHCHMTPRQKPPKVGFGAFGDGAPPRAWMGLSGQFLALERYARGVYGGCQFRARVTIWVPERG